MLHLEREARDWSTYNEYLYNTPEYLGTCGNIMHILPLPLCGLYSICAQNGYGQHRHCKIVLLTLVAPRGITDLYLS